MFHHGALNNVGMEMMTTTGAMISTQAGMKNRYSMEMMLDFAPVGYTLAGGGSAGNLFAGGSSSVGWFAITTPSGADSPDATVRFRTRRGTLTTKSSADGSVTLGKRTVLYGKDDATNVYLWQDGVAKGALAAQADWTDALAVNPLYVNTSEADLIYLGGPAITLRLYEWWIKVDGVLVRHFRPKWKDRGYTTTYAGVSGIGAVPDLAGYHDLLVTSASYVENTDYRFVKAYGRAPAARGGASV